jgi:hypothetical protein
VRRQLDEFFGHWLRFALALHNGLHGSDHYT